MDYRVSSADWRKHVTDSEKSLQYFFDQCHAAGASRCPFYADSPAKISQRLDTLLNKVKAQPVPVYTSGDPDYGVLEYYQVKNGIFQSLYSPPSNFFALAKGLAELERGNGSIMFKLGAPDPHAEFVGAIACSDGKKVTDDAAALQKYYDSFKDSSLFASLVGAIRISCSFVLFSALSSLILTLCLQWLASSYSIPRTNGRKNELPSSSHQQHRW